MPDRRSRFTATVWGGHCRARVLMLAGAAAGTLTALGITSAIALAQSQSTFRTGIDLVQLDVVVLDRNRRPVQGLTASDFTILEDGRPRTIEAFAPVTLPVRTSAATASWARDVAPDVVSNERPDEGRLVVIMMDRSIWTGAQTVTARRIAHAAIDALGPTDLAAVVTSSGFRNEGTVQNFTADKVRLRAAVDSPRMGLVNPPEMTQGGLVWGQPDLVTTGDCPCGVCVMDAIAGVADALRAERTRQKVLLFVGSDIVIQLDPREKFECSNASTVAREKALRALDIANVTVHSIDTTGLDTLQKRAEFGPPRTKTQELARQGNLSVLPDYTGGRAVFNANAPENTAAGVFEESRVYYVLGFQRTAGKAGEPLRNIRVQVNADDVTVRFRTGYYAPAPNAAADGAKTDVLEEAVRGALPAAGLPLRLALTPSFTPDGGTQVSVLLGIGRSGSRGLQSANVAADTPARLFETLIAVLDPAGRPLGSERQAVEVPAALADAELIESSSTLALAPGRYEIRVGVSEPSTRQTGSTYGYVDVPDATREPLSVSGIVLETLQTGSAPDAPSVPGAATLRRSFAPEDAIAARVLVHRSQASPTSLVLRVIGETGAVEATTNVTLDEAGFSPGGVAEFRAALPLRGLEPGRHLLSVEVSAGGTTARRELPFDVR